MQGARIDADPEAVADRQQIGLAGDHDGDRADAEAHFIERGRDLGREDEVVGPVPWLGEEERAERIGRGLPAPAEELGRAEMHQRARAIRVAQSGSAGRRERGAQPRRRSIVVEIAVRREGTREWVLSLGREDHWSEQEEQEEEPGRRTQDHGRIGSRTMSVRRSVSPACARSVRS